jgi:xylono-1,5-lactonase
MTDGYQVLSGNIRCELGEGPWWSARENAIYWVDILRPALHRLSLADGALRSWSMPERIGWVIERRARPGFIAGFQSGFAELSLDPLAIRHVVDPEPQYPANRMNDAKVDQHGRIWAGTMDYEIKRATGSLYRLDTDFSVALMDTGYLITNGPAFSPEGDYLYHTETGEGVVYRFEMTKDGGIANKAPFIRFREGWGKPDGMTVDADGCLWVAHWGGGRVSRFTPDGEFERAVHLPASQVTSCVFAGERLDRMFVTSAAQGREGEPYAGALFEVDPRARGVAPVLFGG